ncbi:MAG: hypothetical protein SFU57_04735 [Gemmatimonadales bacterium]|nr:hypothetical protein [Gemmatimonadales bacterium]
MQQQEKVVLAVSLAVTLMAGWVQVGEADDGATAKRRQKACFLIERGQTTCPSDETSECQSIAANYGCNGDNLSHASCDPVDDDNFVLHCEFSA